MPLLNIYVDDAAFHRLKLASKDLDRTVEDLAGCAVEEAALEDWKRRGMPKLRKREENTNDRG